MKIKNVILFASCLIVATPVTNLAAAPILEEEEKELFTKTQAATIAGLFGTGVGCIVAISLGEVPHIKSLSEAALTNPGLLAGMIGGAAGLKVGQFVYGLLYNNTRRSQVNIHIKK